MMEIPHFREIVLMAFECPHCGERNSEVQFAGLIGEKGRKYHLRVEPGDLRAINRQVVKSDHATLSVPELEFEKRFFAMFPDSKNNFKSGLRNFVLNQCYAMVKVISTPSGK